MPQTIHYVKADPCGNTTILVLDPVNREQRGMLSKQLMAPDCVGAEQVGYVTLFDGQDDIRIDMMGGEFCGNASRSVAAYMAMKTGKEDAAYKICCSGCEDLLQASIRHLEGNTYDAAIDMPLPKEIDAIIVAVGEMPIRFFRVDFGGIVHFVYVGQNIDLLDKNTYWESVKEYAADSMPDALGLVLFDLHKRSILPAVYVKATDTLYWEQSCGSGTAAVGAVMTCMLKSDFSAAIEQPGGTLTVETVAAEEGVQSIRIGGSVTLSEEKEITL